MQEYVSEVKLQFSEFLFNLANFTRKIVNSEIKQILALLGDKSNLQSNLVNCIVNLTKLFIRLSEFIQKYK